MAQDPEPDEESQDEGQLDTSHDLDMVTIYSSQGTEAEMQAGTIHSLLEANGITSIVSTQPYPPLGIELKVARADIEEAQRVINEAEEAGPEAASEAEAASEESH